MYECHGGYQLHQLHCDLLHCINVLYCTVMYHIRHNPEMPPPSSIPSPFPAPSFPVLSACYELCKDCDHTYKGMHPPTLINVTRAHVRWWECGVWRHTIHTCWHTCELITYLGTGAENRAGVGQMLWQVVVVVGRIVMLAGHVLLARGHGTVRGMRGVGWWGGGQMWF